MDSSSEGAVYNFYLVEVYYTTLRVTRVNEKDFGWLVGCFGFNGPLRQYFSLYRAVSQDREKEEKG